MEKMIKKRDVAVLSGRRWRFSRFFAVVLVLWMFGWPPASRADSDYEFILFGINLKSFDESNWLSVAAGGFTSYMVHELGHALYLSSQGKDWQLRGPTSSGLSVYTPDEMTDTQWRTFGRAGFALQSGIGLCLTSFEGSRQWDFTKGWVMMNAMQMYSYNSHQGEYDDFQVIDRGGGNGDSERLSFTGIATWNVMRLERWDRQVVKNPDQIVQRLWHAASEPQFETTGATDDKPIEPFSVTWDLPAHEPLVSESHLKITILDQNQGGPEFHPPLFSIKKTGQAPWDLSGVEDPPIDPVVIAESTPSRP